MAVGHIKWNPSASRTSQRLAQALQQLDQALFNLAIAFASMNQELDSGVATAYFQSQMGTLDTTVAQALYDEINALQAKLLGNGTTDHVYDAAKQAIAKLG